MDKEIEKLLKMDSLLTEIETKNRIVDVILKDQANAYFSIFDYNEDYKKAYIIAMYEQASIRNDNAIIMINDVLEMLKETAKLCEDMFHSEKSPKSI